ncbi:hypothetical protein IAU59_000174 [Kwoniella sp. CBS 9459]
MSSAPLEPSLYALLPPALLPSLLAHLSLLSIHIDQLHEVNRVYNTANPVIQGQLRNLLFRSTSTSTSTSTSKRTPSSVFAEARRGAEARKKTEKRWKNSLAYTSAPLRGAEYADACVRAVIALDIPAGVDESVDELEDFVNALGFEFSHSYKLQGHLFHIPIPAPIPPANPLTLHLSITRLVPLSSTKKTTTAVRNDLSDQDQQWTTIAETDGSANENPDQPYLVQLKPSRPIQAVSSLSSSGPTSAGGGAPAGGGDIGLADMIGYLNEVAAGVEVVQWTTTSM